MPHKEIHNWLVIDWRNDSTRTRKSEPDPSQLGTHEIATEVHLDVVIPEVEIDELTARVEVPQPRVEATELEDLDEDDVDDWRDVADDELDYFAENCTLSWDMWRTERSDYILRIIDKAPGRPSVDDVREYCDDWIREQVREVAADA